MMEAAPYEYDLLVDLPLAMCDECWRRDYGAMMPSGLCEDCISIMAAA